MKFRLPVYLMLVLALASFAYALPSGATVTAGTPETGAGAGAGSVAAQGGNITEVDLTASTITDSWQGFFGEVSGNITLEDASGDVFYAWDLATTSGEVLASRNSTIDFTTVAGVEVCTVDETLTGTGNDRTNLTFTNATIAPPIVVAGVSIDEACQVFTYVNNQSQSADFEEIILSATGVTSIYTTRIEADTTGYDGATHDYQLLVAETENASISTYFFFVEFD